MSENNLFFGGMPTGPDVKKLNDKWPNPKTGDMFSYEDVARIIGLDYGTSRFRTVTNAWRNDLMTRGIVIGCIKGASFRVLTHDQIVGGTYDDIESMQRKLKRRRRKLTCIDPADDLTRNNRDHAAKLCFHLEKQAKETRQKIAMPNVVSMPRISPSSEDPAAS